jgi:hypothetical protein
MRNFNPCSSKIPKLNDKIRDPFTGEPAPLMSKEWRAP